MPIEAFLERPFSAIALSFLWTCGDQGFIMGPVGRLSREVREATAGFAARQSK